MIININNKNASGEKDQVIISNNVGNEIIVEIDDELKNSEAHAREYYEAFIETGGNSKDFIPIGINVDYEIKCITDTHVSFIISKSETLASAYFTQYFYNIDMESGRYITLKDWIGNDYKKVVARSIESSI